MREAGAHVRDGGEARPLGGGGRPRVEHGEHDVRARARVERAPSLPSEPCRETLFRLVPVLLRHSLLFPCFSF